MILGETEIIKHIASLVFMSVVPVVGLEAKLQAFVIVRKCARDRTAVGDRSPRTRDHQTCHARTKTHLHVRPV
jgi:predicted transcriptional regulator